MDVSPEQTAGLLHLALAYVEAAKSAGAWGVMALFLASALVIAATIHALPRIADALARLRAGVSPREQALERKVLALEATVQRLHHTLTEWSQFMGMFIDDLPDSYDKASLKQLFVPPPLPAAPAEAAPAVAGAAE